MNDQVNYAKIQRIQDNLEALTIGTFGTGFVTDAMLYESGIKATVAQHTSDLVESQTKIKNSTLYNNAIRDISNTVYSLPNVFKKLRNNKTIRIAFWGDSITEGFNNYTDDKYSELLINSIKKTMPDVTVEYTNFALGGRNTTQALSDSYVAVNPETDQNTNFWRSWSTVGKTWKQHISDYAPDLLIIAFGMNDVTNSFSDYNFITNIQGMISYINTNSPNTDIALVSTILPTENKGVYNQNSERTLQIARVAREFAKNNNVTLIDTNRLWRVLLYGVDEEKYTTSEYTNIADCIGKPSYNLEFNIAMSTYSLDTATPTDIKIRTSAYDSYSIIIRLANASGVNRVQLYDSNGGTLVGQVNAQSVNTIKIDGSNYYINGTKFTFYKYLREGIIDSISNQSNISSFTCYVRTKLNETAIYNELDLLGSVNWTTSIGNTGNGINHPTALGHYLSYFMACIPIINSIKNEYIKSDVSNGTIWLTPTLQNGWINYGSSWDNALYRKINGQVRLKGLIKSGTTADGTTLFTLPAGFRPANSKMFVVANDTDSSNIMIDNTGNVKINNHASTAPSNWLSLEGILFDAEQ